MGGFGSGRWRSHNRRELVESCAYISADDLPVTFRSAEEFWLPVRQPTGQVIGNLSCRRVLIERGAVAPALQLHLGSETLPQSIPLGTTPARRGGVRHCFLCPIGIGEDYCAKPSRKLFAPLGAERLGCRQCHNLAYASSQRRAERLTRVNAVADELDEESGVFIDRIDRGEPVDFDKAIRLMRRLSYVTHDLMELMRHPATIIGWAESSEGHDQLR